jgi:metal-sulfur cluster biosynthetic enzyme
METTESPESMGAPQSTSDRPVDRDAVRERIDRVDDPELDRSIVELEYVEEIDIDDGEVTVRFVLPTAWCSPAFAWMMATGIRDEVEPLPDVTSVSVQLVDHMHGEEISTGVNRRQSFQSVFEDADDDVETVRQKLDDKARFARQYSAVRALCDSGLDPEQIAMLTRADVDLEFTSELAAVTVGEGDLVVTVPRDPLASYLSKARETGLATDDTDALFADREGEPLDSNPEAFESVLQNSRLAASNIEGQATICASLHESRNGVSID